MQPTGSHGADPDSHRLGAEGLLLLTAAIWGFAFVAQRAGMAHLGPFAFNAIRFGLGALILGPLASRESIRRASVPVFRTRGVWVTGIVLFLGASLQQAGLVETTAGKAGFITGLYVVFVPLLAVPLGERPGWWTWGGASMAAAGLYMLSVRQDFSLAPGDGLVLLGALSWAVHVHAVGRYAPRIGPLRLARAQFAVCTMASAGLALALERPGVEACGAAVIPLLYSGIVSVGIGYTLQVVAQEHAPPSHAAIILSLEAVFAAIGGWAVLGESISSREALGCAIMLGGMICSQCGPRRRRMHTKAES